MKISSIYRQVIESYRANTRKTSFDNLCLASKYIYRPLSLYVAVPFIKLGISANLLTVLNLIPMAVGYYFMSLGGKENLILGGLLFLSFYIIDYADGNIARFHNWTNFFGKLLDGYIDTFSFLVFLPFAIGITSANTYSLESTPLVFLAIFITICSLFVHYFQMRITHFMFQARVYKKIDENSVAVKEKSTGEESNLSKMTLKKWAVWVKSNSNMATPVILLFFVLIDRPEFFLYYFFLIHCMLGFLEVILTFRANYKELYNTPTALRRKFNI